MAQALRKLIVKIDDFTDEEKSEMLKACTANRCVANAYYVPEAINEAFGITTPTADAPVESADVLF